MAIAKTERLCLILILASCLIQFCAAEELAARRDWDYVRPFFPSMLDDRFPFVQLARDANAIAMANTRVDWLETPESHVFKADLPGLSKQDVRVEIEDGNTLRISAHRKKEKIEDADKWHRVERVEGSFLRTFRLPGDSKVEDIKAEMLNGVLTVTIPKLDQPKRLIQPVEIIDSSSVSSASDSSGSSKSSDL